MGGNCCTEQEKDQEDNDPILPKDRDQGKSAHKDDLPDASKSETSGEYDTPDEFPTSHKRQEDPNRSGSDNRDLSRSLTQFVSNVYSGPGDMSHSMTDSAYSTSCGYGDRSSSCHYDRSTDEWDRAPHPGFGEYSVNTSTHPPPAPSQFSTALFGAATPQGSMLHAGISPCRTPTTPKKVSEGLNDLDLQPNECGHNDGAVGPGYGGRKMYTIGAGNTRHTRSLAKSEYTQEIPPPKPTKQGEWRSVEQNSHSWEASGHQRPPTSTEGMYQSLPSDTFWPLPQSFETQDSPVPEIRCATGPLPSSRDSDAGFDNGGHPTTTKRKKGKVFEQNGSPRLWTRSQASSRMSHPQKHTPQILRRHLDDVCEADGETSSDSDDVSQDPPKQKYKSKQREEGLRPRRNAKEEDMEPSDADAKHSETGQVKLAITVIIESGTHTPLPPTTVNVKTLK